ncbi:MAG TPA: MBL fold metallo-hydrolase [Anaerolineae bacterium]|nr:MBL fold metallo-hydrolase [Anaerolineae bacterium]
MTNIRKFRLGQASITVINTGDLQLKMADWLKVSPEVWSQFYPIDLYNEPLHLPTQCIHIKIGRTSILIDANVYDVSADSSYAIPNYQPPLDLIASLIESGIRPEDVTHVIITHAHFDHYNGTTTQRNGILVPKFANALYYLGRADWDDPDTQTALKEKGSLQHRTLGVLHDHAVLELVEGDRDLIEGVSIIAAPGESPGHQIVRVHSDDQTLYCVGDLYHHPAEAEHPTWHANWADAESILASRDAFTSRALAENAIVIATHIPSIGRLQQTPSGVNWIEAEMT